MSEVNKVPDFLKMAETLKKDVVRFASVAGVNFFQDSFQNQGFTDQAFEAWEKRANDFDPGRKILVQSGFLMQSIQVFDANEQKITFGSDAEHADIHNNGGTIKITITKKARKYFWFMFKATGVGMWKGLALTKKTSISIKIPKRQFIGESKTLMTELETWAITEIQKRFKQL
jgi:phage gpG-like protein